MGTVRKRPQAEEDLFDIWQYIARDDQGAADRFIGKFDEAFRLLASLPYSGQPRPELGPDIRSRPVDTYVIFYRPLPDGIEVVRVLHGHQDIDSIFEL